MHVHTLSKSFQLVAAAALGIALSASPAVAADRQNLVADFRVGAPSSSAPTDAFDGIRWEQEPAVSVSTSTPDDQTRPRVIPFEYSAAYRTRAKRIHRIASFATLPLFAVEGILGQSLYDNPTSAKRGAHSGVAAAIGVLSG